MMDSGDERLANGRVQLHRGDCIDVLSWLDENSIDACVTDPPYHLTSIVNRFGDENATPIRSNMECPGGASPFKRPTKGFMGQKWDGGDIAFQPDTWREVYRVLKPGAHMCVFGGTRTQHRMICAIEDAGFEIRDAIMWLYSSGFPKSHDVSKGIDRVAPRAGMFAPFAAHYAECRQAAGLTHNAICAAGKFHAEHNHGGASVNWEAGYCVPTCEQWQILQPLLGLSNDWLPLINRIEAKRDKIGEREHSDPMHWYAERREMAKGIIDITAPATDAAREWKGWGTALKPAVEIVCLARKPLSEKTVAANVLKWGTGALNIDGCRIVTDELKSRSSVAWASGVAYCGSVDGPLRNTCEYDGSKGRWPANVAHDGSDEVLAGFPENQSSRSEVTLKPGDIYGGGAGLPSHTGIYGFDDSGSAARFFYTSKAGADDRLGSKHPTVKPVDLMQWLCRLVTPPSGTILDPFAGTGTMGEAAIREGFRAVLIEREERYCADIRRRMRLAMSGPDERQRESIKAARRVNLDPGPLFGGDA